MLMFYIKDNLGELDKLIPVGEMKWLQWLSLRMFRMILKKTISNISSTSFVSLSIREQEKLPNIFTGSVNL